MSMDFPIPAGLDESHPLHDWPVELPDASSPMSRGLRVALLHKSGLYEAAESWPGVTLGVLTSLSSLGEAFLRWSSARSEWSRHPSATAGQLSQRVSEADYAVKDVVRSLEWLRVSCLLGRGEQANGIWSRQTALMMFNQVVGWYVVNGYTAEATQLVTQVLGASEKLARIADPIGRLQKALGSDVVSEILIESSGPDHERVFEGTLTLPDGSRVSAIAGSKKDCRRRVAEVVLEQHFPHLLAETSGDLDSNRPVWIPNLRQNSRIKAVASLLDMADSWVPLLQQGLVHSSWAYENSKVAALHRQASNARLGFLGSNSLAVDAVMRQTIKVLETRKLTYSFLTPTTEELSEAGRKIGLDSALILGKGQIGKVTNEIAANAFQAVHATKALELGSPNCSASAVGQWREALILAAPEVERSVDPKTRLQEIAQACGLEWTLADVEDGPDHLRTYETTLTLRSPFLKASVSLKGDAVPRRTSAHISACAKAGTYFDMVSRPESASTLANTRPDFRMAGFLIRHFLSQLPTSGSRASRWRQLGLFGGGIGASSEWRTWAMAIDRIMATQVLLPPDPAELDAYLHAVIAQERPFDALMDGVATVARMVAELADDKDPQQVKLDQVVAEISDVTGALRIRAADLKPAGLLSDFIRDWSLLFRADVTADLDGLADLTVSSRVSEALGFVLRHLGSAPVRLSAFQATPADVAILTVTGELEADADVRSLDRLPPWFAAVDATWLVDLTTDELKITFGESAQGKGPVERSLDRALSLGDPQLDGAIATVLHDVKNQVAAASAASRLEGATRTETLRRQLAVSEHLDKAASRIHEVAVRTRILSEAVGACQVDSFIREYANSVLSSLPPGVRLVFDAPPEACVVRVSETTLRFMLDNLVKNSVEAMAGSGVLRLTCQAVPDEGALIELADSGAGFPSDVLEAFGHGMVRTTKLAGNGIGLAAVHQLVMQAGGDVIVSNGPEGAIVVITLPTVDDEEAS